MNFTLNHTNGLQIQIRFILLEFEQGNTMKLDPHFLAMLLKACSEVEFDDEEIEVENSVLEFLESLLEKHPEQEVAQYYLNELSRLRGEHDSST